MRKKYLYFLLIILFASFMKLFYMWWGPNKAELESNYNQEYKHTDLRTIQDPFLCMDSVVKPNSEDKQQLPYGMRKAEYLLIRVLKQLEKCDVPMTVKKKFSKKCIVVGNGGVLRNKTLGEKIDSYDIIIRLNNGPVIGHEKDVGKRTTFRLCYPESIFSNSSHYDPDTIVVLLIFKQEDLQWLLDLINGKKVNAKGHWKAPADTLIYKLSQIRILNPIFLKIAAFEFLHLPLVHDKKKMPVHPTTGIIATALALHLCDETHIVGFKYNFNEPNSSLHYYEDVSMSAMTKVQSRKQQCRLLHIAPPMCLNPTLEGPPLEGGKLVPRQKCAKESMETETEQTTSRWDSS
ncbi:type 2 lactosamine alpha-2,3-sialyltransferase isoform X2 [Latimeria chalumnae]|uniref:type 2 lactosamine alpha-2,3-sialyltransferase isoform X2 n=1 Tax=Latimeria chalumnae TaxID=7897 RepID=UPI00313DA2F6